MVPTTSTDRKRLIQLDILRSVAILIVVFYHLPANLGLRDSFFLTNSLYVSFISFATWFAIALFFFISGLVIDINSKTMRSRDDVIRFYEKRGKRIYPLYWLAFFIVIGGYTAGSVLHNLGSLGGLLGLEFPTYSSLTVLINFIGAQAIVQTAVDFNWFVGVILVYYAVYPLILHLSLNNSKKMIVVSVLLFVVFVIGLRITVIDPRFFQYYFIFIFGILINRRGVLGKSQSKRTLFLYSAGAIVFTSLYFQLAQMHIIPGVNGNNTIISGFSAAALDILLFDVAIAFCLMVSLCLANYYSHIMKERSRSFFSYVAFSSYAVFLFHQAYLPILGKSLRALAHLGYLETLLLALLVGVPVLIILCFHVQKETNKLVDRALQRIRPSG